MKKVKRLNVKVTKYFVTYLVLVSHLVMLASSSLVYAGTPDNVMPAPSLDQLPLEMDTQFDANRWYDEWWDSSVKGLKDIPGNFMEDSKDLGRHLKTVFTSGVKIGNVLIIRGAPDTWEILKKHGKKVGIHYRDTITMAPEHAQAAGKEFRESWDHTKNTAEKNWDHTSQIAGEQWQEFMQDQASAKKLMSDVASSWWSGMKSNSKEIKDDVVQNTKDVGRWLEDTWEHTKTILDRTATFTADTMEKNGQNHFDLIERLARWTGKQPQDGYNDTINWTELAASWTKKNTVRQAQKTAKSTVQAVRDAGKDIKDMTRKADEWASSAIEHYERFGDSVEKTSVDVFNKTARATFGEFVPEAKKDIERTKRHAKKLWQKGYDEGLKAGFEEAGDEWFVGDVHGVALAGLYSLGAVVKGVSYLLVAFPITMTADAGWGLTKTVGFYGAGGLAATTAVGALGAVATAGARVTQFGLTVGTAALAGTAIAGQTAVSGLDIALTATGRGLLTGAVAVGGGLMTAGAATVGTVRTVGGTAVGALGTVGTVGSLYATSAAIGGMGALGLAGGVALGTARAGLSVGAGVVKSAADIGWGVVKMAGLTAYDGTLEVLVPTLVTGVTAGRAGYVGANFLWDNLAKTPTVATWDLLSALTIGGWHFVKDPAKGTYHLVAGLTGFTYRVAALGSAMTLTLAFDALYTLLHAPLSLVYYGGMWSLAAGGKLFDKAFSWIDFSTQKTWKDERLPQLRELLLNQSPQVLEQIGNKVEYIRVVASGDDRGKVKWFNTEKNGNVYEFERKVRKNCLVVYVEEDEKITLNSQTYEPRCVEKLKRVGK